MHELHIVINNKIATYMRRDGFVVCNNDDYMIVFAFDDEWDAYPNKTARFIWNNRYTDVPFTGNTVELPMVKNATLVKVGVYAGDLRTTTPARIECKKSILCGQVFENPNEEDPPEIPEGYIYPTGTKTITKNGTHDVREYAAAYVNVENSPTEKIRLQEEKTATKNGEVLPDEGYDGLKKVNVALPLLSFATDKNCVIKADGESIAGWSSIKVDVKPNTKALNVTENGVYNPPEGVDGYSSVTVNVEGGNSNTTTTALDFSNYENGSFTETLSNGIVLTHTIIFDGDLPIWVDNIDVNGV